MYIPKYICIYMYINIYIYIYIYHNQGIKIHEFPLYNTPINSIENMKKIQKNDFIIENLNINPLYDGVTKKFEDTFHGKKNKNKNEFNAKLNTDTNINPDKNNTDMNINQDINDTDMNINQDVDNTDMNINPDINDTDVNINPNINNTDIVNPDTVIRQLILHDIHANGLGPNWGYFESLEYLLGIYLYLYVYMCR
jgi:hypothetical protein